MIAVDAKDLWHQIPPEEKFEMIARAHSRGVLAAFISIVAFCTVAVGLQIPWLVWASLLFSPLVFQFISGKAWRDLRPKIMLEHLAARSASRRFAFSYQAKDLGIVTQFRGVLEEMFDAERISDSLEQILEDKKAEEVWVTLFNDAVTMLVEKPGGAVLKLAHLIDESLEVRSEVPAGEREYSPNHAVLISFEDRHAVRHIYKLTSRYPAALIVFEKKILQRLKGPSRPSTSSQTAALPLNDDALFGQAATI